MSEWHLGTHYPPEAEHAEKIKLVQKSLDKNRTIMNGSLALMKLIYKHIPNLIKPKITGLLVLTHKLPLDF